MYIIFYRQLLSLLIKNNSSEHLLLLLFFFFSLWLLSLLLLSVLLLWDLPQTSQRHEVEVAPTWVQASNWNVVIEQNFNTSTQVHINYFLTLEEKPLHTVKLMTACHQSFWELGQAWWGIEFNLFKKKHEIKGVQNDTCTVKWSINCFIGYPPPL